MEWVESTGGTIDEAKDVALDRLGVHEDDAEFEVVSDVTTGLFGRVKEEARVRARVRPATPRAKDDRRRQRGKSRGRARGQGGSDRGNDRGKRQGGSRQEGGKAKKEESRDGQQKQGGRKQGRQRQGAANGDTDKTRASEGQERKNQKSAARSGKSERKNGNNERGRDERHEKRDKTVSDEQPTMPLVEQAGLAEDFVSGLAERFGTSVEFQREDVEDDEIRITVSGDDLGRMVGRRGSTAGAIDELVRTVLQRQAGSARNGRIRVDIGGVRARRAEALAGFARAQAEEVRNGGASRAMEPMGAADRKIVHDALTDEAGVDTISEGEDPRRRVVIVPVEGDD